MSEPERPKDETAAYIARVLAGLHEVAGQKRELAMLGYILELAKQEAEARAKDKSSFRRSEE